MVRSASDQGPGRVVDILEACGAFDPGSNPGRGATCQNSNPIHYLVPFNPKAYYMLGFVPIMYTSFLVSGLVAPRCPHPKFGERMTRAYIRKEGKFVGCHWYCVRWGMNPVQPRQQGLGNSLYTEKRDTNFFINSVVRGYIYTAVNS
jgi:hypothetical protein